MEILPDHLLFKKYRTELVARGIANIKKLAVVFSGKAVYVKENSRPMENL